MKDGYAIGNIEARLNVDELQKYLNTDVTDMAVLWTMLVDKTEGRNMESTIEAEDVSPNIEIKITDSGVHYASIKKEQTVEESNAKPEKIRVVKAAPVIAAPKKRGRPAKNK